MSLLASAIYVADKSAEGIEQELKRDALMIGRQLAGTVPSFLVVNNYIAIEETLASTRSDHEVRELSVTDPKGHVVSQVQVGPDGDMHASFSMASYVPPASETPTQIVMNGHLISWSPARLGDIVGWVRVDTDLSAIDSAQRKVYTQTALVAVAAFLFALLVSMLYLRPRLRALTAVTEFAKSLSLSQSRRLVVSDICNEIHVLGTTLNETAARLEANAREIVESEARQRAVVENMPVMLLAYDEQSKLVAWNKECERVTEYSAAEVIGSPTALALLVPNKDFRNTLLMFSSPSDHGSYDQEVELVTKSGEQRIIAWSNISSAYAIPGWKAWAVGIDVTGRVKSERIKNAFIASVNHELRTPLTAIRGSLAMLRSGVAGALPAGIKNLIEMADRNSERLLLLINNILEVQRLDLGYTQLEKKCLDVAKLVQSNIDINTPLADHAGVSLVMENDAHNVKGLADELKIGQVLTNLISNGIKHAPKGTRVVVSIQRVADAVRVSVVDQGQGVRQEIQEHMFSRFAGAVVDVNTQVAGSGLGLYISRLMIEQNGGTIGFSSPPGEGATFYFDLPIHE